MLCCKKQPTLFTLGLQHHVILNHTTLRDAHESIITTFQAALLQHINASVRLQQMNFLIFCIAAKQTDNVKCITFCYTSHHIRITLMSTSQSINRAQKTLQCSKRYTSLDQSSGSEVWVDSCVSSMEASALGDRPCVSE